MDILIYGILNLIINAKEKSLLALPISIKIINNGCCCVRLYGLWKGQLSLLWYWRIPSLCLDQQCIYIVQ